MQHKTIQVAVLSIFTAMAARADIVVFEQLPNGENSLDSDQAGPSLSQHVADDFSLHSTETITSIAFWGIYANTPDPLDDQFTIRFYSDNGGVGTLLHSTPVNIMSRSLSGTIFNQDEYYYVADLVLPYTALNDNTYWISIRNNTRSNPQRGWSWETGDGLGNGSAFSHPGSGGWQHNSNAELAFSLFAVPSPGCFSVLGAAACLITVRNRRHS